MAYLIAQCFAAYDLSTYIDILCEQNRVIVGFYDVVLDFSEGIQCVWPWCWCLVVSPGNYNITIVIYMTLYRVIIDFFDVVLDFSEGIQGVWSWCWCFVVSPRNDNITIVIYTLL